VQADNSRRWARAAAGVALALILAGLVAVVLRDEPEPDAADVGGPGIDIAAAALGAVAAAQLGASVPPATASSPAAASVAASEPVDAACPPAWRALAGQPVDAVDRAFHRLRPAALSHAARLLAASSDPFERVAGQLLGARAKAPDEAPPPEAFLSLVSEALAGSDLRVAGLAAQVCASPSTEPPAPCASFTPQHWAAADPDNIQPWLALAAQAQDNGDPAGVREALARAAQAGTNRLVSAELPRLVRSPALQALPPVEREVLVIDLLGVGNALTAVGSLEVSRLCPGQGAGLVRQQQCSQIAERLVDQGQTLIERGIGISIGRRSGWDARRVAELEEEHVALLEALGEATGLAPASNGPMTLAEACETWRRVDAVTALITTDTEIALARHALQQRQQQATAAAGDQR
jgi:hypothetical protein